MQRAERLLGFVLHQREWSEGGRILEIFTRERGRMSLFAHGVRGPKAKLAAVLRPFSPLRLSWAGRGEAPRLIGAEPAEGSLPRLSPERVLSGYYLNELLLDLTLRHDPQPELFDHYAEAMSELAASGSLEHSLRLFEKRLLEVLGYGLPRSRLVDEQDPLGVAQISQSSLQALHDERLDDPRVLTEIKPLLRRALNHCLEGRKLHTREVAAALRQLGEASS